MPPIERFIGFGQSRNDSLRFLHSTAVAKKRIKARVQARRADKQPQPEADI